MLDSHKIYVVNKKSSQDIVAKLKRLSFCEFGCGFRIKPHFFMP